MRISHLQQREPIFSILESTLARFWSRRLDDEVTVRWKTAAPAESVNWFCNPWLNVIFPPHVDRRAFEPTCREFARSTVAWRRPVQQAYVRWATTGCTRRWLGCGPLRVSHPIPNQTATVVIPGNHKIRILDYEEQRCYCLLKTGFSPEPFQRELATRRIAAELGLPVPTLLDDAQPDSFCEAYLAGTPLNRLPDPSHQTNCWLAAARELRPLYEQTQEKQDTQRYVDRLARRIGQRIHDIHLLDAADKDRITRLLDPLQTSILNGPKVPAQTITAITHGDFQPANILWGEDQVWIIDWEYAARRQAAYDALVSIAAARRPDGLASRLRQWVQQPATGSSELIATINPPGLQVNSRDERAFHGHLFWLEELDFHLAENANPLFRRLNHGFTTFVRELENWLHE